MSLVVRSSQFLGGASHMGGHPYPEIYKACIAQATGFTGRVSFLVTCLNMTIEEVVWELLLNLERIGGPKIALRGGDGMGARRRRVGGGVPETGFRAGPFVLCKDGYCHQRR